jgi:hypothetical protein
MKKLVLLYFIFYLTPFFAQVGIDTTSPTASLDVNGNLRVRTLTSTPNNSAAKDSILVSDNLGNIKRVSSKTVIESHLKTFIKGSFSGSTDISLTLASGTKKIPFNLEEFDENDEFNTTTNTFTATQSGIYAINVAIKTTSSISIALDFGVAILKNGTVINRNSFANIGVLGINVTPPVRSVQTIVSLNSGDTINFNIICNIASLSLDLLSNKEDCYFTIHQVR